ncbi:MAG: hypothetical protein ACREOF_09140 [Gemmatimonadales bacterium]
MRIPIVGLLSGSILAAVLVDRAPAQAVALPLRGQGELELPHQVQDVRQGSVLLQADRTVSVVFIVAGVPRTFLTGRWRMTGDRTAHLAVHTVLGSNAAQGTGSVRFRPDGSVEDLEARGVAGGRAFTLHFENSTSVTLAGVTPADSEPLETGAAPPPRAGNEDWPPWGGNLAVLDVTRRGGGRLQDATIGEQRLDRARLVLGDNDEFVLVLDGDARAEFAGVWRGDLRHSPIQLELREAFGDEVGGVGRAWIRERSWDRDWSFERVELDGWNDAGGDAFTLYFEAERPW